MFIPTLFTAFVKHEVSLPIVAVKGNSYTSIINSFLHGKIVAHSLN